MTRVIVDLNSWRYRGLRTDPTLHRERFEHARGATMPEGTGWFNTPADDWHWGSVAHFPSDRWLRTFLDVPIDEVLLATDVDPGDEDDGSERRRKWGAL